MVNGLKVQYELLMKNVKIKFSKLIDTERKVFMNF